MANATVVLYLVHEDYAIDRTVVLHSTVPVVVEHVVVLHIVAPCQGAPVFASRFTFSS